MKKFEPQRYLNHKNQEVEQMPSEQAAINELIDAVETLQKKLLSECCSERIYTLGSERVGENTARGVAHYCSKCNKPITK